MSAVLPLLGGLLLGRFVATFRIAVTAQAILFAISAAAQTGTWQIDPNHSNPQFSVRHLGISTVRGSFSKVNGTVQYDPANGHTTA